MYATYGGVAARAQEDEDLVERCTSMRITREHDQVGHHLTKDFPNTDMSLNNREMNSV